jgi:protein lifeguard
VIAIVAAVLFTAYLIYDLQLLMGGGARELSPDEYIFASVNIYLDIVQIFLNILSIIGIISN